MGCLFFGFLLICLFAALHAANAAHMNPLILIAGLLLIVVFKRSARL